MSPPRTRSDVINRDFLETRGRILEVAAALDRLDRAEVGPSGQDDIRFDQLRRAVEVLAKAGPDRAERLQRLFSLEYEPAWRDRFNLSTPTGGNGQGH